MDGFEYRQSDEFDIVSSAGSSDRRELHDAVEELGYKFRAIEVERWLQADTQSLGRPSILNLCGSKLPRERVVRMLTQRHGILTLAVIGCDRVTLDVDLINHCSDFLFWPCNSEELKQRLGRVFGASKPTTDNASQIAFLDQFIGQNILGNSPVLLDTLKRVNKFAGRDAPVLVEGETGTGKELIARAIHYLSGRRDYPFIPVNCGAIPDSLLENELFGHERGAFTDAKEKSSGIVAQVREGTLFLDELDTLSSKGQVTLLRFLDNQEYRPLGSGEPRKANVRVIAATNANLENLIAEDRFRQDLLYRLNVLSVRMPPLRERGQDVKVLAERFIAEISAQYGELPKILHEQTLDWMVRYRWPGNVRELKNLLHREFSLAEGPVIWIPDKTASKVSSAPEVRVDTISHDISFSKAKATVIADFENRYLRSLMANTGGNVSLAARRAGKDRSALRRLLQKHGIERADWSSGDSRD